MEIFHSHSESTDNLVPFAQALPINNTTLNQGATLQANPDAEHDTPEQSCGFPQTVFKNHFLNCFGPVHIPLYQHGEKFEKLVKKMIVVENTDRKIKKRILHEGYGPILPHLCLVTIFYKAYLNGKSKPFKVTHFTFRLNDEKQTGLRIAVQTMKLHETSQFLVHPDYVKHIREAPSNSTILYEVETIQYLEFVIRSPSEENNADFSKIYKSALALCCKGNELYRKGLMREAIKQYDIAESNLDECRIKKRADYKTQQKLLLRLRSNLVIAYTKIQEPCLTCLIYNRIHYMCQRIKMKISAKIYFNHARSLILLSHYECAEKQLQRAQNLEPRNLEIAKDLMRLDSKKKEHYDREMALAKTTFKNMEITRELDDKDEITEEFEECLTEYCKALNKDEESILYNLPDTLTETEIEFVKKQAFQNGLQLKCTEAYGRVLYIVVKTSKLAAYNN